MMTSLVKEATTAPKAPAMITATASSSTLPRMMKPLNSFSIVVLVELMIGCFDKEPKD